MAKLMKRPTPIRSNMEQMPSPLVGQATAAIGASVSIGRNDVRQAFGQE